jgi:Flp pilus assembly protein TadG
MISLDAPQAWGRFVRDTKGTVLAWTALLLPVILGAATLATDIGRMYSLQTQLQNAADAAALAGAAELNGRPDSIARANAAIAAFANNDQFFAAAGRAEVALGAPRFLTGVPATDAAPLTAFTTDPLRARFIEITATPTRMTFVFPLLAGLREANAQATAVAGRQEVACAYTPMFLCNPYEGQATTFEMATNSELERRRQYRLRIGGGQWGPGNYGFLEPRSGNGTNGIRTDIATGTPTQCFTVNGAEVNTGLRTAVNDGFNVRFDIYDGPMNSRRSDPAYRPARNATKGFTYSGGNACNASSSYNPNLQPNAQTTATNAMPLPRDTAFSNLGATGVQSRGNGTWDFVRYLQRNHNRTAGGPPSTVTINNSVTGADVTYTINYATGTVLPAGQLPSRYDVYRWESDNNRIPNSGGYNIVNASGPNTARIGTNERGAAGCFSGTPGGIERRIMYVAVINCTANQADLVGSSGAPIPVLAYARMFLTEPAERSGPNSDIIIAELAGVEEPSAGSDIIRAEVQLVR